MHGDHYFGLIGLLSTMHMLGRTNELHIYAPAELKQVIDVQLKASEASIDMAVPCMAFILVRRRGVSACLHDGSSAVHRALLMVVLASEDIYDRSRRFLSSLGPHEHRQQLERQPTMNNSKVIVLGSVNTDLVIRGQRIPQPGETVLGGTFYRAAGGKGANQAVAAARASSEPVTFIAAVGDDAFGREAVAGFQNENLDRRFMRVVPNANSGVALILVDAAGENSIAGASGANLE